MPLHGRERGAELAGGEVFQGEEPAVEFGGGEPPLVEFFVWHGLRPGKSGRGCVGAGLQADRLSRVV